MNVLHDLCDILMAAPGVHPTCSQPSKVHLDPKRKPQMRSHLPSLPGHFTKYTFDNIALHSNALHVASVSVSQQGAVLDKNETANALPRSMFTWAHLKLTSHSTWYFIKCTTISATRLLRTKSLRNYDGVVMLLRFSLSAANPGAFPWRRITQMSFHLLWIPGYISNLPLILPDKCHKLVED